MRYKIKQDGHGHWLVFGEFEEVVKSAGLFRGEAVREKHWWRVTVEGGKARPYHTPAFPFDTEKNARKFVKRLQDKKAYIID